MSLEPNEIYSFLGQDARWSTPWPTYFSDALWSQHLEEELSSSPTLSSEDSRSSNNMRPQWTTPSVDSRSSTTDDVSSAATPEPPRDSSPPVDVLENSSPASIEALQGLGRFDDSLTTPQLDKRELPRPPKLDIAGKTKSRRVDVDKTNQVRGAGACIRCRLQKVSCTTSYGQCDTCAKACSQTPGVAWCNRRDLATVARDLAHKRFSCLSRKEDHVVNDILRNVRPVFGGNVFEGQIFFDRNCLGSGIPAYLRNYTCAASASSVSHQDFTFARNHHQPCLSQQDQMEWAERSMSSDDFRTFEGAVESFIRVYVRSTHYNSRQRPQFALLEKIHTFKSAYRACCSPTFYFAQANGKSIVELPALAQAELRGIARSALESSERYILSELDKYLKSPRIPDQDRPAVWAALWQLIFVYRDLLRNRPPLQNDAEALFNAVAVFYASLFRTTTALKALENLKGTWLPHDMQHVEMCDAFAYAMSRRDTFHRSIVAGVAAVDQSLKMLVVDPEMKVLRRRPTVRRPAGAKRGVLNDYDDDKIMGGY